MSRQPLRVLLCGAFDDVEMKPVAASLVRLLPGSDQRRIPRLDVDGVRLSSAAGEDSWAPDLVVVAQTRPEPFSQTEVRQLQSRFPLARCVCCCGAWCESDGRNSSLWPDAVRVPARSAASRIRRELAVLEGRVAPLPWTASRDEIFEFDACGDWGVDFQKVAVRVNSPDRELKRTIESLLASRGCQSVPPECDVAPDAVIWDADPWRESTADELRSYHRQDPHVPVIALMNFGHSQAAAEVVAYGASAVVAKLSCPEELFAALSDVAKNKDKRQKPPMNADKRR